MQNTYVETTGQFHDSDGVRTLRSRPGKIYDGYEEGYEGTIQQQDGQAVVVTTEGNTLNLSNLPDGLSLPLENIYVTGVTHDGEFDWKSIDTRTMSGGGGGGGGMGFHQLNLSGTPIPLPTNIPLPETPSVADLPLFEGQRGILLSPFITCLMEVNAPNIFWPPAVRFYPYIRLEGGSCKPAGISQSACGDLGGR